MERQVEEGRRRRRRPSIVGPLLLIVLGVVFLLNTLNVLPWTVWDSLWRLWPVALILVGLEILLGRGNPWLSALLAVLVIGIAGTAAFIGYFGYLGTWSWGPQAVVDVSSQHVAVPLQDINDASLTLRFGAGRLRLDALAGAGDNLIEGDLRGDQGSVEPRVSTSGNRTDVTLEMPQRGAIRVGPGSATSWYLSLNPSVTYDITVQGGAAESDLDLRGLRVRDLNVDLGASSTRVRLPEAAGQTTAKLRTGAAELRVDVPEGVAARITSSGGLSSFNVDQGRFPKQGGVYVSPNYDTAANRVDLSIDAGLASVTVR